MPRDQVQRNTVRKPKGDENRREEMLNTAASMFATSGFRTSLQEIAEACGILPGSLYHHFTSKEAIILELVHRYKADLDEISEQAMAAEAKDSTRPLYDRVLVFAEAIIGCAIRHRAAMIQTFYDAPPGTSEELLVWAKHRPRSCDTAMRSILENGHAKGELRDGIDIAVLAELLCQAMLNSGVGVFHRSASARFVPAVKCRMLLNGLSLEPLTDQDLNASAAFTTAQKIIAGWDHGFSDDPAGKLRAATRSEFGRRGYDATTMRTIAVAAGMSVGAVYRLARSKDELLTSIMTAHIERIGSGWGAIMASRSSPIEKLDALLWFDINVADQFTDEFKIQLDWLRQSPPTSVDVTQMESRHQHLQDLVEEGERTGQLRNAGASSMVRVRCLLALTWIPENIVRSVGVERAFALTRDSLIRGATTR
jgi:AcrR family transcriptional regulator